MVTTKYKPGFDRLIAPLVDGLVRCRIHPTTITIGGLVLVAVSCAFLLATRRVFPFCLLVTVAALTDAVDGAVARATGQASRFGSYLDAMCDRYVESGVMCTVAVVTGYWALSMVLVIGSLLVSYAKARAAMEVAVSNVEWPDLMERTERDVVYIIGLAASSLLPVTVLGRDLFWWTLAVLCVLVHLTVAQRMWRAGRFIRSREESLGK